MIRFFTSPEPVAFLPLPNLAALVVISCRAFEIGLIDAIADDPIVAALNSIAAREGG